MASVPICGHFDGEDHGILLELQGQCAPVSDNPLLGYGSLVSDIATEQLKVMDVHSSYPHSVLTHSQDNSGPDRAHLVRASCNVKILSDHPRRNRERKDVAWDSTGKHLAAAKRSLSDAVAANEAGEVDWRGS